MKYFKASFKGVSFEVSSSEGMFGRRVQEHEFPFADANVFEDLGKASQAFIVDGFVIGDDFQARAENLIKVLESKGPGKLVHPWLGTLEVYAVAPMRIKWSLEDRIAQISMSFKKVEAEQKPSLSIASDYLSRLYADSFLETAVNAFKTGYECYQNITNLAIDIDKALSQGISQVTDFLSTIASSEFAVFNGIQASIKSLISEVDTILSYDEPEKIATAITTALDITHKAQSSLNWRQNVLFATKVVDTKVLVPKSMSSMLDTEVLIASNERAMQDLIRLTILSQAVGMSSLIGTSQDINDRSTAQITVAATTDVITVKNALVASLDKEENYTNSYDVLQVIQKARSSVWNDLSVRAESAESIHDINLFVAKPALLIAYEQYGNALRDKEIIDRNSITNPNLIVGSIKLKAS